MDIAHRRLCNQRLVADPFEHPQDVVRWLGAVQAQDYAGAKWALAQRTDGIDDAGIDRLFDDGAILRTHVMRPTWHFVAPEDIRWILELTAPRVHAASAYYYRRLELDSATLGRGHDLLAEVLGGGKQLTRAELARAFETAGIGASGLRLGYLIMHAELEAVVCSGARRGKQQTYALLDERVRESRSLDRDEALAALARRYFTGHGPALARDFSWWSGLTVTQAKLGIELAGPELMREEVEGKEYWFGVPPAEAQPTASVHLLPNYDEFFIAYKDRSASFDPSSLKETSSLREVLGGHVIVVDGRVIGGWRRSIRKGRMTIAATLLVALDDIRRSALEAAAARYGRFMGLPVELVVE